MTFEKFFLLIICVYLRHCYLRQSAWNGLRFLFQFFVSVRCTLYLFYVSCCYKNRRCYAAKLSMVICASFVLAFLCIGTFAHYSHWCIDTLFISFSIVYFFYKYYRCYAAENIHCCLTFAICKLFILSNLHIDLGA